MKALIGSDLGGYTFNKTAKTVTLTGLSYNLTLNQILLITNVTSNVIIYNFTDVAKGATQIVNNVITLTYNTSSMSNTDILQIFVDVYTDEESFAGLLRRMNKLLESQAIVDSSGRQRVTADSIPTCAVTNLTGLGPNVTGNTPGGDPYLIPFDPLTNIKDEWGAYIPGTGTKLPTPTMPVTERVVDQRWRICDDTHRTYCDGIRRQLSW